MKIQFHLFSALSLVFTIQGCGATKSKSQNPNHTEDSDFVLSGEALELFESWVGLPRKTCRASAIFGTENERSVSQSKEAGIDAVWLYHQLQGQLELTDDDGLRFARLAPPAGGTPGESSYEAVTEVNGHRTSFAASTKSDGVNCEVYVKERLIKTVPIYKQLRVVEGYHADKEVEGLQETSVEESRRSSLAPVEQLITAHLRPSESDLRWVAATIGLSFDDHPLVVAGSDYGSGFDLPIYTFPDVISIPPATVSNQWYAAYADIVSTQSELSTLHPESSEYERRFIRAFQRSRFPSLPEEYIQPEGLMQLDASFVYKKNPRSRAYSIKLAKLSALEPRIVSAEEALDCAGQRLDRLLLDDRSRSLRVGSTFPGRQTTLAACQAMRFDFVEDLVTTEVGRSFLQRVFSGTVGSGDRAAFFGWDDLIFLAGAAVLELGGDLVSQLDPDAKLPIVQAANDYLSDIRLLVARFPDSAAFDGQEERLSLSWAISGLQLERDFIVRLFETADSISDPFVRAARVLMADSRDGPSSIKDKLEFAQSIDEEWFSYARDVVLKAKDAPASIAAFVGRKVDNVLDQSTSKHSWYSYLTTIDDAREFIGRENKRIADDPQQRFEFDRHIETIVGRAMEEYWTDRDFIAVETITDLAQFDPFCERKQTATAAVECRIFSGKVSKKPGLLLDPQFAYRYVELAEVFSKKLSLLEGAEFYSAKNDLLRSFAAPVWASCGSRDFDEKRREFSTLVRRLANSSFTERSGVERALRDYLKDC